MFGFDLSPDQANNSKKMSTVFTYFWQHCSQFASNPLEARQLTDAALSHFLPGVPPLCSTLHFWVPSESSVLRFCKLYLRSLIEASLMRLSTRGPNCDFFE